MCDCDCYCHCNPYGTVEPMGGVAKAILLGVLVGGFALLLRLII